MYKQSYVVTIETDNDIIEKYPNYRFNWDHPGDFIDHLMRDFAQHGTGEFGYTITYKEKKNV
jgi:hypothetical protein